MEEIIENLLIFGVGIVIGVVGMVCFIIFDKPKPGGG